jgi:hypothetical protein
VTGCSKLNLGSKQVEALRCNCAVQGTQPQERRRMRNERTGRAPEGPSVNVLDEELETQSTKKREGKYGERMERVEEDKIRSDPPKPNSIPGPFPRHHPSSPLKLL